MEQQDAINIVKDIIQNGKRHKHYHHTVKKAKEYRAIITGDGIDNYMHKFPRRETEDEFKQRVDLTINITETVAGNNIDPQRKISRSNSIERHFFYIDNDKEKQAELQYLLENFWEGNRSVEDYMSETWVDLNNIDPNSVIVVDWKTNTDGKRIKPYPVEYPADQVYHFSKRDGVLDWICVHRDETHFDPEMYILYSKDFAVIFSRKWDEIVWNYKADIEYYKEFPIDDFNGKVAVMKDNDTYWDVHIPQPHNLNIVPAMFAGFVRDLQTRQTYISFIYKAIPILKKIVKANSELDLTMALHAFPQKIQYTDPCPECQGNGKMRDGTKCETCNGKGVDPKKVHSTALDVLQIPKPRDAEDIIDLSKMVYYVKGDVELLKFQEEHIEKLTRKCKEAVYNSEVFTRGNVAETAYAKNIDLQHVYDALWNMAKAYSRTQNFIVNLIARVSNLHENLVYKMSFRKDFKMKALTDLYNDLKIVGDSNADEFVKKGIEQDIAKILYEDDEVEMNRHNTQNYFFPFNGKNKKEIEIIATNTSLTDEKTRVLWANFSWIFEELETKYNSMNKDFYKLDRKKQKEEIDSIVDQIIKDINKNKEINVGENLPGTQEEDGFLQDGVEGGDQSVS